MLNLLLAIDKANLKKAFEITWKGVVAIFIVIFLVIIATMLVNKACVKLEEKAKERKELEENQPPEQKNS